MFQIVNDRAVLSGLPVAFVPAPKSNVGGRIRPRIVVIHDTAGTTAAGAVSWFQNPRSKVSAHFVVERDGTVTQMVACDIAGHHAGKSSYRGTPNCNTFSVGIEIVSPGMLYADGPVCRSRWIAGKTWPLSECAEVDSKPHGGRAWWHHYTPKQVQAVEGLIRALAIAYPSIVDVVGHYEISPRRKVDPGPHFDLDRLRAILADREEPDPNVVAVAQIELARLGFFPGKADGIMGPRTEAALMSFQKENGLPITGTIDRVTFARLDDVDAKPMPNAAREEATKEDVKAAGSETMTEASAVKRGTEVAGVVEAANATSQILTQIETAKDTGDRTSSIIDWLASPAGFKSLATLLVLGGIWYAANRVEWARVRDYIRGANLGR
jgi:N-acetylmuramoyl-L-alanine amidase